MHHCAQHHSPDAAWPNRSAARPHPAAPTSPPFQVFFDDGRLQRCRPEDPSSCQTYTGLNFDTAGPMVHVPETGQVILASAWVMHACCRNQLDKPCYFLNQCNNNERFTSFAYLNGYIYAGERTASRVLAAFGMWSQAFAAFLTESCMFGAQAQSGFGWVRWRLEAQTLNPRTQPSQTLASSLPPPHARPTACSGSACSKKVNGCDYFNQLGSRITAQVYAESYLWGESSSLRPCLTVPS